MQVDLVTTINNQKGHLHRLLHCCRGILHRIPSKRNGDDYDLVVFYGDDGDGGGGGDGGGDDGEGDDGEGGDGRAGSGDRCLLVFTLTPFLIRL